MNRRQVIEIIVFFYILLFVYAAMSKLFDHTRFFTQLERSPLLGSFASIVVWLVPGLELVIAFFLMFGRTRLVALISAVGLMVAFTVYIVLILFFSNFIPCSCGGVLEYMGWSEHLVFNIIVTSAGVIGLVFQVKESRHQLIT